MPTNCDPTSKNSIPRTSASLRRNALLTGALLLAASSAAAQHVRITGQILRGQPGGDDVPLAGAWAVLHEVHTHGGAPIDSARSDAAGRYRLSLTADSGAIYLVSATHDGVTYFSGAVNPAGGVDTAGALVVFDTSSAAPDITVAQRHIIVRAPVTDGGRRVLELIVLANHGRQTRVVSGTVEAVWRGRLPPGAEEFEVGESDVSAQAVARRGDTVLVSAPIPPGQKQILYTYLLPAGVDELRVPIDQPMARFNVLLEDTAAVLTSGSVEPRGIQVFDDAQFAMYDAAALPAGPSVTFEFGRTPFRLVQYWGALVALAAVAMTVALMRWARRRPAVVVVSDDPNALARAIAQLDARHEAHRDVSAAAAQAYAEERGRLKARLEAALAARQAPR